MLWILLILVLASCGNDQDPWPPDCDFSDWEPPLPWGPTASKILAPASDWCGRIPRGPAPKYVLVVAVEGDSTLLGWPEHPKAWGYLVYFKSHGQKTVHRRPLQATRARVADSEVREWRRCPGSPPRCLQGPWPRPWGVANVWYQRGAVSKITWTEKHDHR